MNEIFNAVDLASVTVFVTATGIIIVSIYLAFKAIDFSKRAIQGLSDEYRSDWMERNIDRVDDDTGYYSKDADGSWSHKKHD